MLVLAISENLLLWLITKRNIQKQPLLARWSSNLEWIDTSNPSHTTPPSQNLMQMFSPGNGHQTPHATISQVTRLSSSTALFLMKTLTDVGLDIWTSFCPVSRGRFTYLISFLRCFTQITDMNRGAQWVGGWPHTSRFGGWNPSSALPVDFSMFSPCHAGFLWLLWFPLAVQTQAGRLICVSTLPLSVYVPCDGLASRRGSAGII